MPSVKRRGVPKLISGCNRMNFVPGEQGATVAGNREEWDTLTWRFWDIYLTKTQLHLLVAVLTVAAGKSLAYLLKNLPSQQVKGLCSSRSRARL
jgi:hypothetical protein